MKIAKVVCGVCAGILLLSGCMTEGPVKQRAAEERIKLIGNSSFDIELLSAKTLINDDGLLTVDASTLLSRTGSLRWVFSGDPKVTVWYHFDWIDAQGNICPPVQREIIALPGNIIDFHGVAPDEKYINYRLIISLKEPTVEGTEKRHEEIQKEVAEKGEVKPAGKSQAQVITTDTGAKPAAKPAAKKAEAKPAAKPAEKKAEAKPADNSGSEKKSKQQKLTEPFD